jgi:transcriptional regulator with XRE-family HTH domain
MRQVTRTEFSADRLREARRASGMSRTVAAYTVGRSVEALVGWESGRNRPRVDTLGRLADVYGIPVGDLFVAMPDRHV